MADGPLKLFFGEDDRKNAKNFAVSGKSATFVVAKGLLPRFGKMPEWSIGTVSKTVVPLRVPRVRIPVFPLSPFPSRGRGLFFII